MPDQESKLALEDEYRQKLLELQQQLSCVPSPAAAFVEESIGPSRAMPPSGSHALHSLQSSVSSPSLPALLQQHSTAPASAAPAPATFKFLLPKDYKPKYYKKMSISKALPAAAAGVDVAARKYARIAAIAKNLHLSACDVDCVAVRLFLSSASWQDRCFIVKINGDAAKKQDPYPDDEQEGQVDVCGRLYLVYSSTDLCALQMLLNKAVCFPASNPVLMSEMGAAFIQIVVPSQFNHKIYHSQTLFHVTSYVLRNMFAHLREQSFRRATDTGGILTATKLWLQEQHVFGNDESFWRPFDIAEYVFHGSPFAYVFPLCYRHIRECLRLQKSSISPRFLETILQCMPASSPDFEIPSMLDWYFDHQGESCSLRVLMAINDETELNSRLRSGSPPPAASADRVAKPGRHKTACNHVFYSTFVSCLQQFFSMVQSLKLQKSNAGLATSKRVFFCKDPSFSIDSTASAAQAAPLVWLGLGEEEVIIETGQTFCICKPVAIKSHQNVDPEIFSRMMRQMKPGSFIASAQELDLHVHGVNGRHISPSPRSGQADSSDCGKYWVSEAGICTLHELFANGVLEEERSTQTHRRLVKEVCILLRCRLDQTLACTAFPAFPAKSLN